MRSLINYITISTKQSSQVIHTHVFKGYDIHSDHFLAIFKITLMSRWIKPNLRRSKEELFRVSVLQEENIGKQDRLNQLLIEEDAKEMSNNE